MMRLPMPPPVAAAPEPPRPSASWQVAAALALLWLALLGFYTRGNGFPYYYHNDEPSKIAQVLGGKRNFYHPQLLLVTAGAILRASGGGNDPQAGVVAGRTASAGFAAGAVCLLALLACRLRGLAAAAAAAALAGTHPLLYELAHYMKEDCAWLCGLAAFFLAAWNLEARPTAARAALLGAAAGLATSGKYLGIVCLPAGALFVWCVNRQTGAARGRWLGVLAGGFLLAFGAVNWQALAHPLQALAGVRQETVKLEAFAAQQSGRLQWKAPGKYLKHAWPAEAPLAAVFAGWFCFAPRRWRDAPPAAGRTGAEWLLLLLPAALLVILLFAPRVYDRYLLPVVAAHALLAALGAAAVGSGLARLTGRASARGLTTLALGLLAASAQWPAVAECQRELRADPRAELCAWLRANVPPDALVAHDSRALLTWGRQAALRPAYDFPQPTIQGGPTLADLGSLETFRPWGVHWFVVAEEDYDSLLHPPYGWRTAAQSRALYDAFYNPLFAQGKKVWERPRGRLIYLRPALRVYYLEGFSNDATSHN